MKYLEDVFGKLCGGAGDIRHWRGRIMLPAFRGNVLPVGLLPDAFHNGGS